MFLHELQGPLGNVIASLELLAFEIPPDSTNSPLSAMLDIARRSSRRLETIIHSLRDIYRLDVAQPILEQNRTSMFELINQAYQIERMNFEYRRVQFDNKLLPNIPDILVEEDMVRRVLTNLLNNILRYSSENQRINISSQTQQNRNNLLIKIANQESDIPKQVRKMIFEEKDADTKGSDLALIFCRLAIEAHGGHLWIEDEPPSGVRFCFTLPLA